MAVAEARQPAARARPRHAATPALAIVVLVGGVAAAVVVGARYPALLALSAGWLVLAAAVFRRPQLAVPVIVLLLPLEISKLFFPFLSTRQELGGGLPPTSIVDVGRLAIVTAGAVWALNPRLPRSLAFAGSALTLPSLTLLALYALSVLWARDVEAARSETLRLAFLIAFAALIPVFVRDRQTLRWCLFALIASAALLAVAGVYQQATGVFFWNEGLGLYGERRINATFADPNHFARLLLLALVLGIALFFFVERWWRPLLAAALAFCALTLVFTGSRSAWLIAAPLLPLLVLLLPLSGRLRLRLLAAGGLALVAAVALGLAVSPYFRDRIETFRFGAEASGARPYLIEAGLHMFRDHPVWGVGAGGYQDSFVNDYYYYKDPKIKANVTLSHTSAVTVISELGVLGAVAALFLLFRWARIGGRLWANGASETKALVLGLWGMSLVILLSSQTEGRLFDDPYLWLAFGLGVALQRIAREEESTSRAGLLSR
ncbi:MAG: O-antigen ligase family protein [Dehalococcoidia bacterium]|nr:O-antigen ligase family protein [Dehalococcoidia bacterium]